MTQESQKLQNDSENQQSIVNIEKSAVNKNNIVTLQMINDALESMPPPPPGGYLPLWKKKIKKRFFKPKTNWSMLSTLIALASLIAMLLLTYK